MKSFDDSNETGGISPELVEVEIDGVLDLHTFHPREAKDLVSHYLQECYRRGIAEVRIIHGKGTGSLRRQVHSVLERHPNVISFTTPTDSSSWGATVVTLDLSSQSKKGDD